MMTYIDERGVVVPTTAMERDLDAAFRSGEPICSWCGFLMEEHINSDMRECQEAIERVLPSEY